MGGWGKQSSSAESYIRCLMWFCSETSGLNAEYKDACFLYLLNYIYGKMGLACILEWIHIEGF